LGLRHRTLSTLDVEKEAIELERCDEMFDDVDEDEDNEHT
jgi:hypothetical protein